MKCKQNLARFLPILLAALHLGACGGGGGGSEDQADNTRFSSVASVSIVEPGVNCPNGGIAVDSGIDENGNGILDSNEIDSSEIICNGIDGSDGTDGTNGTNGTDGTDGLNGTNGSDGTDGVNGANGTDGNNGINALVNQSIEAAGANCDYGGIRFDVGIDNNPVNGSLDPAEITSTEYICGTQNPLADNARLDGIQLSIGLLDQSFQSSQLDYSASVYFLTDRIRITAFTEDENASLSIAGVPTISGEASELIFLSEGANSIVIAVTAEDGISTRSYNLSISRHSLQAFVERAGVSINKPDGAGPSSSFGYSVSLSGDSLAVGAYSLGSSAAVYMFTRSNGVWRQQDKVNDPDGSFADNYFGYSVSLSGNTLAVGSCKDDDNGEDSGAAYVFTRSGEVWIQQAKLTAADGLAGDEFGRSVSLSGDSLAVGAIFGDGNVANSGAVYTFTRSGEAWNPQSKVTAVDGGANDFFGHSISLSGHNSLAVGALYGRGKVSNSGAAYVYTYGILNGWTQQGKVMAKDGATNDLFGNSVSLSDDTLAVGAFGDNDTATDSGSAYVFTRSVGAWSQQARLTASDGGTVNYRFGNSVSLSGDILAVGSFGDDSTGATIGGAYVFTRSDGVWYEKTRRTAASQVDFGYDVSLSGDSLAVGISKWGGAAFVFQ